jgi:hypothetical protein
MLLPWGEPNNRGYVTVLRGPRTPRRRRKQLPLLRVRPTVKPIILKPPPNHAQAARSAAAAALLPILRRQASMMKPSIISANESAQSSDTPRGEAEHTDVASPLDPVCSDSPCGPWNEDAPPCELPSNFNTTMVLTDRQAVCLEELALQRQCALSAVQQDTHGPRGLRAVLPEGSVAAVRLEACRAAEARCGCKSAATPARPCDIALRCCFVRESPVCTMSMPERATSSACSLMQSHSMPPFRAAPEATVALPAFSGLPRALPAPHAGPSTTVDGRDAQGRCVDAEAYKRFYGFWPGREARLTFAEWQRELQPPYVPSKRAKRQPKPTVPVMTAARAGSELQALQVDPPSVWRASRGDTDMFDKDRSWLRCTHDSARCMHSNLACSKPCLLPLTSDSGQLPQLSDDECVQSVDAACPAIVQDAPSPTYHSRQGYGEMSSQTMSALDCASSFQHND